MIQSEATTEEISEVKYAGFWKRFLSYLLDALVLFIPIYCIQSFVFGSTLETPKMAIDQIVNLSIWGVYYVFCETSSWQATVGKKVVGIKVTDMDGNKVSVGQAITRYLMMIPAALVLLIGILMVAFTDKKQGLHDKVAKTLVICA